MGEEGDFATGEPADAAAGESISSEEVFLEKQLLLGLGRESSCAVGVELDAILQRRASSTVARRVSQSDCKRLSSV